MDAAKSMRIALVGSILGVLVLAGLAFVFFISPQQARADDADMQLETLESQLVAKRAELAGLESLKEELDEKRAELGLLRQQLPMTEMQSELTLALNQMATLHNVEIQAITPGAATVGDITASGNPSDPNAQVAQDAAADSVATGTIDPDEALDTATGGLASQLPNSATMSEMPMSIQITGKFADSVNFVGALQKDMVRIMNVNSVNMSAIAETAEVSTTLDTMVYWLGPVGDEQPMNMEEAVAAANGENSDADDAAGPTTGAGSDPAADQSQN